MPYIYSLAWKVASDDYTIQRPLVMDWRTDPRTWNVGDQFMFGPALMVAPVRSAGDSASVNPPRALTQDRFFRAACPLGCKVIVNARVSPEAGCRGRRRPRKPSGFHGRLPTGAHPSTSRTVA